MVEALEAVIPAGRKRSVWQAKCLYVLSTVKQIQFERGVGPQDWVPVYSVALDDIVQTRCRCRAIEHCVEAGVLEQDRSYRVGTVGRPGESMKYRFAPAYWGARVGKVEITDPAIIRNLARAAERDRRAVDAEALLGAMAAALDRFGVEGGPDRPELRGRREWGLARNLRRSGVGQRAYHGLTNLPRELRQYIRADGKEVWAADVSGSQPLLYGLLLRMARTGDVPDDLPDLLKAALPRLPLVDGDELDRYIRSIERGEAYDAVVDLTGIDRTIVKLSWMRVVFGVPEEVSDAQGWANDRDPAFRAVCAAFKRLYPTVYGCLPAVWRAFGRGGLPDLLQRFESWLFIDRLAARLHAEHPEAVFTTCHDSLIGPKDTVERFVREVEHEYRVLFGATPFVKVEHWSRPQAPKVGYEQALFEGRMPPGSKLGVYEWLKGKAEAIPDDTQDITSVYLRSILPLPRIPSLCSALRSVSEYHASSDETALNAHDLFTDSDGDGGQQERAVVPPNLLR